MRKLSVTGTILLVTAGLGAGCAVREDQPPTVAGSPSSTDTATERTPPVTTPQPSAPAGGDPSSSSRPPVSSNPPPTLGRPSAPPKTPTDNRFADRIAGRVTRGGDGPCYGVVTDDGTEYALYAPDAGTFPTGSHVRVRIGAAPAGVDCGPGRLVGVVWIEPVG